MTDLLERTGWLAGQARMHEPGCPPATCPAPARAPDGSTAAGTATTAAALQTEIAARLRLPELARELRGPGRRLAVLFLGYSALGYLVIELLPTGFLTAMLSGHSPARRG